MATPFSGLKDVPAGIETVDKYGLKGGYFYEFNITMERGKIDIGKLGDDLTAHDGDVLTGSDMTNYKSIRIEDGATVTLDAVTMNVPVDSYHPGLTCKGNATIVLKGENAITVNGQHPAIFVPEGSTLTIKEDETGGSLTAENKGTGDLVGGAGIGGGSTKDYSYDYTKCGNIEIVSGTVEASGSPNAAGIGGGMGTEENNTSCGTITIASGVTKVTARRRNSFGYAIGAGYNGTCGDIYIGGEKKEQNVFDVGEYIYPSE